MEIVDSTFKGNASGGGGAAINNAGSGTVLIERSDIVDNPGEMIVDPEYHPDPARPEPRSPPLVPAPGVYEPDSSAIVNQGEFDVVGAIHIVDSTIEDNYAHHDGAGVANSGHGILTIEGSTFRHNRTEADGGAIYSSGGALTISDTTISGNEAHGGGGVYSAGDSNAIGLRSRVTITDTKIAGNDAVVFPEPAPPDPANLAEAGGGGMVLDGESHVILTDVEIDGNRAGDGGGGFSASGSLSLMATRLIVTDNKTYGEGGGVYTDTERPVVIRDSQILRNQGGFPEPPEPGEPPALGTPGGPVFETVGNVAGGGGMYTEGGAVTIEGSTFAENVATEEGGGISIDNFGKVEIKDTIVRDNRAGADGGGIENSGMRTTFDRLRVTGNKATIDGGGIYNSSSDEFLVIDSTMQGNTALDGGGFANAPDADLIIKQSSIIGNFARMPGLDDGGLRLDGGEGGGFWSKADGNAIIENTTISSNTAAISGGGAFHDADGELKFSNVTVWRNSAPYGGGIGVVESDFSPEVPAKANESVILRNSVVGGSLAGGSCDWYVTSEGGNVTGGSVPRVPTPGIFRTDVPIPLINGCFTNPAPGTLDSMVEGLRDRLGNARLDNLADNGGPTLTNAARRESLAVDTALLPCPETDQRGVERPQNDRCDAGAYEYEGTPPDADDEPPDTQYVSGPIQDTLETTAFRFTGTDNKTATDELMYECRLVELEVTEAPEPIAPWDPVPPELQWAPCTSPWPVPLMEEGFFDFEVRAYDRRGNVDPTPAVHHFDGADPNPPQTIIVEHPPAISNSRAATFSFTATHPNTPASSWSTSAASTRAIPSCGSSASTRT